MENNKRGYHVVITENETGKTNEFDTKGFVAVHLEEVPEEEVEHGKRQIGTFGVGVDQRWDGVTPLELFSLLDGLQCVIQELMEENPTLQTLMMIVESKRRKIRDEED